jgi:hypothetical protein
MRECAGDKAIWYSVQCMQVMGRGSAMRLANPGGEAREPDGKNGKAAWVERVQELEAENTRLHALVCYLVHSNEELRRKRNDGER